MGETLERELQAFEANKVELVDNFEGKFALVKDGEVVDVFDTEFDAIRQGYKRFGPVPLLVKQIVEFETPLYFASGLSGLLEVRS